MRIYVIGDRNQELENLNSGRNEVIYTSIFSAIFTTLFNRGSIIYSEKENSVLDVLQVTISIWKAREYIRV